jgi:hypothetical protein
VVQIRLGAHPLVKAISFGGFAGWLQTIWMQEGMHAPT